MRPADDPAVDYKALVRSGYDRCADSFAAARAQGSTAALAPLLARLPAGSSVLDLGCGAGVPIARALAESHELLGIDFSAEQIRLARANVPSGRFLCAELMRAELPPGSFDAAVAFYVVFHLPREEHAELFRRIWGWLRPGGYLLATVTRACEPAYLEDHFGVTMYWSNFGLAEYRELLAGIGFDLLAVGEQGHGYGDGYRGPAELHPLIFARRPERVA